MPRTSCLPSSLPTVLAAEDSTLSKALLDFLAVDFLVEDLPEEEVDFVLDRPFLFAITGVDRLPLFVGVVNQPISE